jgi:hypothetical protein
MKKLCFFLMALFTAAAVFSADLQVIAPNGDERWQLGSPQKIKWRAQDITGNVRLILFHEGERIGIIADEIPASRGICDWTAGSYQSGGTTVQAGPGGGYKVRIRATGLAVEDDSDRPFTLYALQAKKPAATAQGKPLTAPTIKVLSPNGGESYFTGREMTVRYRTEGSIDRITINLIRKTPTVFFTNICSNSPNSGEHRFDIPNLIGAGRDPGTWVIEANGHVSGDTWVKDESDRSFSIQRGLDLELTLRDLTIYSRKRGADGWSIAATLVAPPIAGPVEANRAQETVSFRIHTELNIKNAGAEWPRVPLTTPWRVRIYNVGTHAEFGSEVGTVDLITTGTAAVASADIIMDADVIGVFDVEIIADPDHTLQEADIFWANNKITRTFSIQ